LERAAVTVEMERIKGSKSLMMMMKIMGFFGWIYLAEKEPVRQMAIKLPSA
jgi:hypothetical protein